MNIVTGMKLWKNKMSWLVLNA